MKKSIFNLFTNNVRVNDVLRTCSIKSNTADAHWDSYSDSYYHDTYNDSYDDTYNDSYHDEYRDSFLNEKPKNKVLVLNKKK